MLPGEALPRNTMLQKRYLKMSIQSMQAGICWLRGVSGSGKTLLADSVFDDCKSTDPASYDIAARLSGTMPLEFDDI